MALFEIDTGDAPDPLRNVPDWARDAAESDDPVVVLRSYGQHLLGGLLPPRTAVGWQRRAKKNETVRKHLLADWWFLRDLAKVHPGLFDEILQAYADRIAEG